MMVCLPRSSKKDEDERAKFMMQEEEMMGPPSKIQEASEHAQELVLESRVAIEMKLGSFWPTKDLQATEMMTQHVVGSISHSVHCGFDSQCGKMYFIKVKTSNKEWPWCFVKLYEPPNPDEDNHVMFRGIRKMHTELNLITF